VKIHLFLNLI